MRACTILLVGLLVALIGAAQAGQNQPGAKDFAGDPLPVGATYRLGSTRWRHADTVGFAQFLPDGKSIVSVGDDMVIRLWEFPSGNEIRRISLRANDDFVRIGRPVSARSGPSLFAAAALSRDGKTLATFFADGSPIRLHDLASGKELRVLEYRAEGGRFADTISEMVFDKDATKLFVRNADGSVQVWDAGAGKLLQSFNKSSNNNTARFLRDTTTGAGMSLSPDGKTLLVIGSGYAIDLHDVASGKSLTASSGHSVALVAVQFTADGKQLLTRDAEGMMHRWSAGTGKDLGRLSMPEPAGPAFLLAGGGFALSPDGKLMAQLSRGAAPGISIIVTDLANEKELATIEIGKATLAARATSLVFSPDGSVLAIASLSAPREPKLELYESASGKLLHALLAPANPKDGGGKRPGPANRGTMAIFSPDGATLASYSGQNLLLWNTTTGKLMGALPLGDLAPLRSAAFTPDGRCLAVDHNDDTVSLYELATSQVRHVYGDKTPQPMKVARVLIAALDASGIAPHLAIGRDGRTLALAKSDQTVSIWDMTTDKELASFKGHSGAVNAVAFAPDGKSLASASADTTALVWDLSKLERPKLPAQALVVADLDKYWRALAGTDAAQARLAMKLLQAAPQDAVKYVKEHLQPAVELDAKAIDEWIAQLSDGQYKVREKAMSELVKAGEQIVPALDKALAANLPLEARKRLENLRSHMTSTVLQGERLRAFRAVEVLERFGTPQAREVLQALADGVPGVLVTTTARQALKRLGS
jgi:WD40 repeat protein